jgi:hypothetical protein
MIRELARVSSRFVILSLGIVDPAQHLRLGIRQRVVPGTTVPVPCTMREARQLLKDASLTLLRARPIMPMLSAEWIFLTGKGPRLQ